jgi:hypothetical protein
MAIPQAVCRVINNDIIRNAARNISLESDIQHCIPSIWNHTRYVKKGTYLSIWPLMVDGWQPHSHLWADCLENVESSTFHKPNEPPWPVTGIAILVTFTSHSWEWHTMLSSLERANLSRWNRFSWCNKTEFKKQIRSTVFYKICHELYQRNIHILVNPEVVLWINWRIITRKYSYNDKERHTFKL